jgi:hypothetical protein
MEFRFDKNGAIKAMTAEELVAADAAAIRYELAGPLFRPVKPAVGKD